MDIIDIYKEQVYKKSKDKKINDIENNDIENNDIENNDIKNDIENDSKEEESDIDEELIKLLFNKNTEQLESNIIQYDFCKQIKQHKVKKVKKNIIVQENNKTMYQRKFNPRLPPYKLNNI